MSQPPDPLLCQECGQGVQRCDECQHPHDWYDHVGIDHMCRWCLLSEYEDDPLGLPAHLEGISQESSRLRQVRIWSAMQQLRLTLWLRRRLATPEERARWDAAGDDDSSNSRRTAPILGAAGASSGTYPHTVRDGEYLPLERDKGQALADTLVGKSRAEAEQAVSGWRLLVEVADLDATGGRVAMTADYRPGRVRVMVSGGRVVRATYG